RRSYRFQCLPALFLPSRLLMAQNGHSPEALMKREKGKTRRSLRRKLPDITCASSQPPWLMAFIELEFVSTPPPSCRPIWTASYVRSSEGEFSITKTGILRIRCTLCEDDKHIHHAQLNGWHSEEINRYQLTQVISHKRHLAIG